MQVTLSKIWKATLKLYVIVSDTSGLIFLTNIEKLSLLPEMFEKVFITEIVAEEYAKMLPSYIEIRKLSDTAMMEKLEPRLDRGEASAIALSLEIPGSILLLDEIEARVVAKERNLKFIGVLGLLLVAKEERRIDEIKPYLTKLKASGMWISEELFEDILRKAKE